ncbi:MAG: hypothetical protein K1X89_06240 [Myxococcaceae bacterium]|nr:hypothetical protein [Myxococcaceae bacterium]
MPKTLTQAEATEHLERAWNEASRLQLHFSQRPKVEKKRLGLLQQVVPKLKRLAKGSASPADAVTQDELAVLQTLVPAAAPAKEAAPAKPEPAAKAPAADKAAPAAKKASAAKKK